MVQAQKQKTRRSRSTRELTAQPALTCGSPPVTSWHSATCCHTEIRNRLPHPAAISQRVAPFETHRTFKCNNVMWVSQVQFEGCQGTAVPSQPGNCTRDRSLEGAEVGAGIVVDVRLPRSLKQELERPRLRPRNHQYVEVEQCRKFITRSEKRVAESDAERAAEFSALTKAKGRFQCLEAQQAAATSLPEPSAPLLPSPECAEIVALKEKVDEVEGERDAAIRNQSNKRPAVASASADQPMPMSRVPRELSEWLQACHEELVAGNESRVMELSSRLSDAPKMSESMGVMVP